MTKSPNESTSSLLGDAMAHVSALVRGEVDLARAEIDQNLRRAGTAIGLLVAALVVALTALNVLVGAIVAGLAEAGMDPGWAAFAVGVVLVIVAYGFVQKGLNDLKLSSIAPSRAAANVQRDVEAVKGAANAK
ncbi:phage holin family protein [Marinovum sp. SP66]|uniref:phage holin family protein n=1 Tax=Marinovum TaxID=367771 RepID=UPI00237A1048|nr:phage holin family protein [Marinovum sp. SP66]MDD9741590.1 phage holin family protein [Marinovum sp. SP66]